MAQRQVPYGPQFGVPTVGTGLSGASIGVKLSYTCSAGRNAMLRFASIANIAGGAPTIQIRVTNGGVTVVLASTTTGTNLAPNYPLNAGDIVDLNVSALVAATTFDGAIGVEEFL